MATRILLDEHEEAILLKALIDVLNMCRLSNTCLKTIVIKFSLW